MVVRASAFSAGLFLNSHLGYPLNDFCQDSLVTFPRGGIPMAVHIVYKIVTSTTTSIYHMLEKVILEVIDVP